MPGDHPWEITTRIREDLLLSDEGLQRVCYGMLPPLEADFPLTRKDQQIARGLRLYDRVVAHG